MSDDPDSVPERDMKYFQFRQMKKIRVFDSPEELPKERSNLLAVSNKFGLTFVGRDRTFKVFLTRNILAANKVEGNPNEIVEGVKSLKVTVELPMHNLALSSDELTLAICGMSDERGLLLSFYDVRTLFNEARPEKLPFASFAPVTSTGALVQDLKWNPVQASVLAACLSDGSMMVLEVTDKVTVQAKLPASVGITCVCWSPKGKQVAAGKLNATVIQYTPSLQEKKVIPCPNFYSSDNPVKVLDILWLSTYVFAVVYAAADGSLETPPELVVVSLPKKDEKREERYLNFNDLVYGACTERQHHYFLSHVEDWDIVLAASAGSIEVSIIAKQEDKTNWELWLLEDASRAELPVTLNNDDTLPVGVAIDYTNQDEIRISDDCVLPPAPTLMLLSTDGVLCPFSLVNQNKDVKQLSVAPVALSLEGERLPSPGSASLTRASAMVTTATTIPMATPAPRTAPLTSAFGSAPISTLAPSASSQTASSSSSSSFSFALPSLSTGPSFFSIPTTTTVSMGTSGFGTTGVMAPTNAAFSFPAAIKPPSEMTMAPTPTGQRLPASSPAASFKPSPEPAALGVKMNLNGRFLAMDTPGPAPQAAREFSVTSVPRPAFSTPLNQSTPAMTSSKPASSSAQARPAQSSTILPPAAVPQPAAPKAITPAQAAGNSPSPQETLAVKAAEKQLQPRKETDPVMAGILEEIAHFQKELDELKARASKADFHVGPAEQMKDLRREAEDLHVFALEIRETTESLHGDIGSLKTTLLEGFAGVEEGKTQRELSKDSRYLQLLYQKPLDPRREEQLKEIRRLYQYVKFSVDDVSDMLDLEWERHLENKKRQRHLIVPGREALFTTLANNLDIINQQQRKLDSLVKDLQALRLYNKTASSNWSMPRPAPPSQQGLDSELESLRETLLKARLESPPKATSESQVKMSPAKQHQLRNFLSKRQTPPVRSTAPANLSRSAFLSPNYYEGLDDGSSTSSLSQALDPEDSRPLEEEVTVVPPALATARHPAVVRTSSVQPGFGIQGPPFGKAPAGFSSIVGPPLGNEINLGGADSTAFATKTVKHGAPPTEKTTPVTVPPQQAAANAALRRQMANQKPGTVSTSLTESNLKTVPQVVNVQELKDKGPAEPVSTVISASVPASAAQVVHQMLAATATNQAKRNSAPGVKASGSTGDSSQPIFVFGGPQKLEAPPGSPASISTPATISALNPAVEQTGKIFTFSAMPAGGFNFSPLSTTTLTPHGTGVALGKDVSPSNKFSFTSGSVSKLVFAPEAPFSLVPKSTSPVPTPTGSPTVLASGSGEPAKAASASATLKTEPQMPKSGSAGETLGSFSGLRVGQGDDEPREAPKPVAPTSFSFGPNEGAPGTSVSDFGFGGSFRLGKPAELAASVEELASGDPPKTGTTIFEGATVTTATPSGGVFKPPEPGPPAAAKSAFSVTQPEAQAPASSPTSFADLLAAPLAPPAAMDAPGTKPTVAISETPAVADIPKPTGTTLDSSVATPFGDVIATQSSSTQAVVAETAIPAAMPEKPLTPPSPAPSPVPTAAQNPTPLVAPPQATQTPATETAKATESAVIATPVTAPAQQGLLSQALVSEKPGSIFAQPVVSTNSTTPGVGAVAPVVSTAAPVTTPVPSLGSTTAGALPTTASVFGQPASTVTTTTTTTTTTTSSSGFGSSGFGVGTSGFGKPVFGQVAGFGQPAAGSSGGFGFGQPAFGSSPGFGQAAAAAPASSSGGGLFGSPASGGASSFSFGQIGASNSSTAAGASLFGHSAAPAFGQQSSGFGQGSVFGSSAPTTTSSTGFGFGQPSAFGSTSAPLFGQQTSGASVFGQSAPSGGGLFGPGASSAAGTTAGSGGFFSGLGGKPSEDAANKNPFGSTSTDFGRSNQAGGFCNAPVFGSPPAFGGSPAFGTASAFGSSPSFSNPMGSTGGKVFGEGTAAANVGGFGFASASTAPTFGSLATQTTPSFGNIATQGSGFGGQTGGFSGFGSPGAFAGNFGSTNQNNQTFGGWRS
ncbi:nuclear pore complex protein Nup214 isoform X2 [Brienomyrus brachyistius]|uniref:nuclear pore complex protein Nup214 isoform X2 n=1 Tax=Brienomyrus brachyistius TaxID=42636 RepID=UPI0020B3EB8C|nr:nuclear pore complex protein Nup214 isoform X2 [Brienomyrus brachyistius]